MMFVLQPEHAIDHYVDILRPHGVVAADIDEERRHAGDPVLAGEFRLLVNVDVDDFDALLLQPTQGGLSLFTRAAPGGTEGEYLGWLTTLVRAGCGWVPDDCWFATDEHRQDNGEAQKEAEEDRKDRIRHMGNL